MSFGVGFGDIVKAIGLAKSVVATYRNAPNQVKELADEYVPSKHILYHRVLSVFHLIQKAVSPDYWVC